MLIGKENLLERMSRKTLGSMGTCGLRPTAHFRKWLKPPSLKVTYSMSEPRLKKAPPIVSEPFHSIATLGHE